MGFPVFLLSLTGESDELLVTTLSSSYSLGDKLVIGMSKAGNTAKQIKVGTRLAVNFLADKEQLISDIAGFVNSHQREELLAKNGANFSVFNGVTYLEEALISIIAKVIQIVTDEHYLHVFLTIESRLIASDDIDFQTFHPLLYVGDDKIRYYKKTTNNIAKSGSML
ncbi:flavin reductase family protein [Pseudolactococcus yaeyamensis]